MRTTNEKVYRCDYCNRAIVSKGSMTVHEKMCKNNPENKHKCFEYCKHLIKSTKTMDFGDEDDILLITEFTCSITGNKMKSYKVKRNSVLLNETKHLIFMPLKCDLYEAEVGHDFSEQEDCSVDDFFDF